MFHAHVRSGKLAMVPSVARNWERFKSGHEGVEVIIEEWKPKRSNRQHRYYWLYVNVIAKETGDSAPALHTLFKREFLPPKHMVAMGREVEVAPSTKTLTKKEFSDYLERICALTGVPLPDPQMAGYLPDKGPVKHYKMPEQAQEPVDPSF